MKFEMSYEEVKAMCEQPTLDLIQRLEIRLLQSDDPEEAKIAFLGELDQIRRIILEHGLELHRLATSSGCRSKIKSKMLIH